ncbi:Bax inhibitor-1/YccA family protein [Pseudorhodoplanes sp.]|jgi:FtsH-binding integral membrane protein|uniref:Bax inhibitor-1/YccA family protein n=1 Tax=Pseudorhodoplanes sp. TaxID=1934341 RepID=UPI002BD65831|nr:Bax inhibitor-1/YccA family protein [Pseudorhodoplanes sp.]HWV43109.1 Bax inhibitor-1/YccA family protein [Pseudorhodoplanes sp.]
MSDFDRNAAAAAGRYADRAVSYDAGLRAHMIRVYNYMAMAVALTGAVAFITFQMVGGSNITVSGGKITGLTPLGQFLFGGPFMWVLMLAPLAMVFVLSFGIQRLAAGTARLIFFAYAALLGVSLATIFIVYTANSIANVFFISAAAFGGLSLYGYTTKRDLSPIGSFLIMGLIGLILASLVNIFLRSDAMSFIISVAGVLIFAGLTAWDTQKIKEMYSATDDEQSSGRKAVMGALALYLDFINLFLMLLRLFGNRR